MSNLIKQIAYVSGPMENYPLLNKPAFDEARELLESLNFKVVIPHELVDGIDLDTTDPELTVEDWKLGLHALLDSHLVVQLTDWMYDPRAALENRVAQGVEIPRILLMNLLENAPQALQLISTLS